MPGYLTYDSPGLTWDSGFLWDQLAPASNSKRMNTKAITDFSKYKDAEMGPASQFIHDQMTANAATFTAPPVPMATLQTQVTSYNTKLGAKASRAIADKIAFDTARATLETTLGKLGNYVNTVAQGDAMTVEKSGFPSYSTARPAVSGPPPAPTNLRLSKGSVSGSVKVRYKTAQQPSINEAQMNAGHPDTEADWHPAGIFKGLTGEIPDQTPGARLWVRVRTVGAKNTPGDWSDPAEIIVT